MNWDDIRLFLALARSGSARGTAVSEGLSHSTVKRRIENLETSLGVRLFDRDVRGYRMTEAGETLFASVLSAEDAFLSAERQIQGQDSELCGEIRLTTIDIIANLLIMPDLVGFNQQYPETDLVLLISEDLFDLNRREADVAIRTLRLDANPPANLVGRKLQTIKSCYYASPQYLSENDPWDKNSSAQWIGWNDSDPFPDWVKQSPFPALRSNGKLNNVNLQIAAAIHGMGITVLPCFIGDHTEGLQRIEHCKPYDSFDIWILSHPDLRDTARLRVFRAYLVDAIKARRSDLIGEDK